MNGILRVRRSRGVLSGLLLVLLGAWGALVPFVGPYFRYAYTPDQAWTYTTGRLWLEILPGAATLLGGLIVLASSYRPVAHFGAWLAALSGAWFTLGSLVGPVWIKMHMVPGVPVGSAVTRAGEQIGFFTGLGVVIVLLAAMAIGRFSVIGVNDARRAAVTQPAAATTTGSRATTSGARRRLSLRRTAPVTDADTNGAGEPATDAAGTAVTRS